MTTAPESRALAAQPSARNSLRPARRRGGFTLVELIACAVLLSVLMLSLAPTMTWVGMQRRAAQQRQLATLEAGNVMERLAARRWEQLTPQAADTIDVSPTVQRSLPEAALTVTVTENAESLPSKQITVELNWKNRQGDFVSPVRLTHWVYRKTAEE